MSSGKPNDESDRQRYLQLNPDTHRVLKRWEIENYLYDKEVLKNYCLRSGTAFDEASYDLFVTDLYDQNLKDETGRIKNICGITTNINAEKFKLALSECVSEEMAVFQELEECIFHRK